MRHRAWWVVVFLGVLGCKKPAPDHHAPAEAGSAVVAHDATATAVAHQGESCPTGTTCDSGLTCVTYRGVGGNELRSCEIPCADSAVTCPEGQQCSTVKDGPGQVCITSSGTPPHVVDAGPADAARPDAGASHAAHQGEKCSTTIACASGLTCVDYRGVGGNELHSCEIPCGGGVVCPTGQGCTTVRDGPGHVCMAGGAPVPTPEQGKACVDGKCATGLECIEYFGIAGPRGPKFTSCEIRCSADKPCTKPQRCITIADGPGQVCRP